MSDTDFLKDYLIRNPSAYAPPPPGVTTDTNTVDATTELEDNGSAKVQTPNVTKLHNKAVKQDANDKEKQARLEQEAQAERVAEEERLKKEKRQSIQDKIDDVTTKADSAIRPLIDRVANLKTVGGIGLLIAILVFLNFVIIPVNQAGDTRLKQLWYMLNGQAQIQGRVIPTGVTPATNGTNFGGNPINNGVTVQPTTPTNSSNGFSSLSTFRPLTGGLN